MTQLVSLALLLVALVDNAPAGDPPSPADVVAALETALADAIAKAEPSVVAIARVKSENSEETTAIRGQHPQRVLEDNIPQERVFGGNDADEDLITNDYGSGVVIGENGDILTAYHVVRGASRIIVRAAGRQKFDAEVIAADPRSDLAVIAPRVMSNEQPPKLKPIPLGDATKLRKGTFLVALGNPFSTARDGTASASWGILSNTARRLDPAPEEQFGRQQLRHYPTLLQIDAKLNLGMSGGAVVNLKGELVGLTTAAASAGGFDAQAGYAIPIDPMIKRVIESLKQGKEAEYGFLGIKLDGHGTNRVGDSQPGTPAGEGGVLSGDAIVEVGGIPVTDSDSLLLAINAMPIGEPIKLKLIRQNEILEKTVVLAKYPVHGTVIATNRPAPWRGLRVDYTSTLQNTTFGADLLVA